MISHVSPERCQCFTVMRTDLKTWDREVLTFVFTTFKLASKRAEWYQKTFDPSREHYDWRVHMCS